MNPIIRIAVVIAAVSGACLIARVAWPVVAGNLAALKSWNRTEGEVRSTNGAIEFEIGREPDSYRAFATVDHTWGLSLFKKAPLLVDPADPARIKPAGFLQLWLSTAEMSVFVLLLLMVAAIGARFGTAQPAAQMPGGPPESRWMFSPSPGPASESIVVLRSPARHWKACIVWSLLGVAMVVLTVLGKGGNPVSRVGYITLGSAFTLFVWGCAWQAQSLEISANNRVVRMTSVLGWRDLPWSMVRTVEDQDIFTTYFNGKLRMWELPFPGSTIRVLALNGDENRTLMSFSPDLEPRDSMKRWFDLCAGRTGLRLQKRKDAIRY